MTKNRRSRDIIAAEIHAVDRTNVFERGALWREAKASSDHNNEWCEWLDENGWSWDTVNRCMKVDELAGRFRNLRKLRLGKVTLYALTEPKNEDLLPAIIDALAKHASETRLLKWREAERVIRLVRLRHAHGDFSDTTLEALDIWCWHPPSDARDAIIGALKKRKPETKEAADKTITGVLRAHVEKLFAPYGKLPAMPSDALVLLNEEVGPGERQKVAERLRATPGPLTVEQVQQTIWDLADDEPEEKDDEPEEADDEPEEVEDESGREEQVPPPKPAPPLASELLDALRVVVRYARQPWPKIIGGITGTELEEIEQFAKGLHKAMHGGNVAKLAADRAEARSRSGGAS